MTTGPATATGGGAISQKHGYSLLLKDSVIYGGGRMLQKFLMIFLLPVFSHFIGPSGYGTLGMVVAFTTLLDVIVTLGFDVAFTRFYFDDKTETHRRNVVTNVFFISTVYPAVLLGGLMAAMPWLAPKILGGAYQHGDWRFFAVALLTLFFTNLNDVPMTIFRLKHKPWWFLSFTLGRVLVQIVTSALFVVVFHWGPMGILLANLAAAVAMQLGALPTYVRLLVLRLDPRLMRTMLDFAIPALFTGISFYFLKLSDRFLLLRFSTKSELGLYTVANSLAQPLYVVMMAFRMAWPQWHYARLHKPEEHKRLVARSATYFLTLSVLLVVLMGAFMPLIVHFIVAPAFWSIGPTTFVLAISIALYGLYFVFWVGANVAKKNRLIPLITLVASAVNIGLNIVLLRRYGMFAAACTTVVGFLLLTIQVYFISNRYYPIPYEWARLSKIVLAAVVTLVAAWGVGRATGQRVDLAAGALALRSLAVAPTMLLFPLVLWASGFFTPTEKAALVRLGRLRRGLEASAEHPPDALSADDLAAEQEQTELEIAMEPDLTEGGGPTL